VISETSHKLTIVHAHFNLAIVTNQTMLNKLEGTWFSCEDGSLSGSIAYKAWTLGINKVQVKASGDFVGRAPLLQQLSKTKVLVFSGSPL
jgi:hypothetical protein